MWSLFTGKKKSKRESRKISGSFKKRDKRISKLEEDDFLEVSIKILIPGCLLKKGFQEWRYYRRGNTTLRGIELHPYQTLFEGALIITSELATVGLLLYAALS